MDPISITASFVGILGAAAKLCALLTKIVTDVNGAPKAAERVLMEVFDITTCLAQLQEYLLIPRAGSRSRKALIMVREVQATLANTVIVFSQLEQIVDSMKLDRPMGTTVRLEWALKENGINKLLYRLQSSKTSLNLILTTLSCNSVEDAQASMRVLNDLVQQVLGNNQEMAQRLAKMEMLLSRSNGAAAPDFHGGNENETKSDPIPIMPKRRRFREGPSKVSSQVEAFGFTFDHDLKCSRVYARAVWRSSAFSVSSSAGRSVGWSIFSGLSLADISDLSVISLPLSAADIWNGERYGDV